MVWQPGGHHQHGEEAGSAQSSGQGGKTSGRRRNSLAVPANLNPMGRARREIEGAKASLAEHAKAEHAKVATQREREMVHQIFLAVDDGMPCRFS